MTEHRKRVLIVDNNEHFLVMLQADLEKTGLDTSVTWSGREALALLGSGDFDVLIVDDYLPDLHAGDFLERVGRLPIQPRVVVMQGSDPNATDVRHYGSFGASAVVDKHDSRRVVEAVRWCCAGEPLTKEQVN